MHINCTVPLVPRIAGLESGNGEINAYMVHKKLYL